MKSINPIRTAPGLSVPLPRTRPGSSRGLFPSLLLAASVAVSSVHAHTAAPAEPGTADVLAPTPFEVTAGDGNEGYTGATTLAGNRLSTDLRDIGSAVTVITKEFLQDVGATDNTSLLQYTTGTEVGG